MGPGTIYLQAKIYTIRLLSLWLLLLLQGTGNLYAQKFNIKVYSVNEGLPHAQVRDIFQTEDGCIWIGTAGGGLSRFNSVNFKTYTVEDGLKDNIVTDIFEDRDENLWVATRSGGIATFEGDSLVYPFTSDSLDKYFVVDMDQSPDGRLWLGTFQGGVFILDGDDITRLTVEDGLADNTVWDFYFTDDSVLIATQAGLSVLHEDSFQNYTSENGLSGDKVFRIVKDEKEKYWMATSNGLTLWNGERFEQILEIGGEPLDYVFDILKSSDGTIWIGTETHGLYTYDGSEYRYFTVRNGLSSDHIFRLYEDRNNDMWIGTDENGISIYRRSGIRYFDEDSGMPEDEVFSIYRDPKGVFWIGTSEGVVTYEGERFTNYSIPGLEEGPGRIWDISGFSNGQILILMEDNTIMEFDGTNFTDFTQRHNLKKWYTYELFVDSRDNLWIGTDEGLFKYDGNKLEAYTQGKSALAGNVINHIYEDEEGNLWIGTTNGLSKFDGSKFTSVYMEDGLNHDQINFVLQDENGDFWLGTSGGVTYYKPPENGEHAVIENFDKDDGMSLIDTQLLWFDEFGNLWQGTNAGMHKLDVPVYQVTGEMHITHHGFSNSGIGIEFNHKAVITDDEGNGWFGTMDGLLTIDPGKMKHVLPAPHVYVNDIKLNGQEINWSESGTESTYGHNESEFPAVTFPHGKNSYTFSFVGIDYFNPQKVRYRYKMGGYENRWMPVSESHSATYTNLDAGNYTFEVQAKSEYSGWSSASATYTFTVDTPFWHTWWFYSLLVSGTGALVYGYIRIRLNYLERKELHKLVDERTADLSEALDEKVVLLKEVHHRVKNNLAVISGLLELHIDQVEDESARKALQESQLRVHSISMIHEKLYQNEKLSRIKFKSYIEEILGIISYSFSADARDISITTDVDTLELSLDQGIPCGLILNELVSNAFEHAFPAGYSGTIKVGFKRRDDKIRMKVTDDGKGLSPDFDITESQSLGLTLVSSLSNQLNGNFKIQREDKGTTFIVDFPYAGEELELI